MKQLTIGDVLSFAKELKNSGVPSKDVNNIPIYIGDDDELNGIHTAWYCQAIKNTEDDQYVREMINESRGNIGINDSDLCVLIS